jgi:hypothetical protein
MTAAMPSMSTSHQGVILTSVSVAVAVVMMQSPFIFVISL